jgi:hypothetical protein
VTTLIEKDVRCVVCGAASRHSALASTRSFGLPDLDLRPAPPRRWALPFLVQRCPACGYCAGRLGEASPRARDVVGSVAYRDVLERSRLPGLARSFFCAALVHEAAGDHDDAAWRMVEAAWACDDHPAPAQARVCRDRAVELFRRALETGDAHAPEGHVLTLVADLLRRARRFDEAIATAESAQASLAEDGHADDPAAGIARFVAALASEGDDDAHTVAEVLAPDEE